MTDTINTRELIMNILLEMDREKTPCHLAVRDASINTSSCRGRTVRLSSGSAREPWNTASRMTTYINQYSKTQDQQMQAGDSCDLTDVGVPDPFS